MAGVISTAVWTGDRFTERQVDIETILSQGKGKAKEEVEPELEKLPSTGLLSQTVIESPVSHWIFAANLGDASERDVVFIGDHSLYIKRLTNTGSITEVGRLTNLQPRIRNAKVLGSVEYDVAKEGSSSTQGDNSAQDGRSSTQKDDSTDISMLGTQEAQKSIRLGPQMIVLALETGSLLFVLALDNGPGAAIQPFTTQYHADISISDEQWGAHLTADPSSRYLAVGCSEDSFSIYALRRTDELEAQYLSEGWTSSVKEERSLQLKGVILHMEFLFPSPADPDHIILLLIIAREGQTRMHLYDWVAGQSLRDIRQNNERGHLLDHTYRMPLLLVPLRRGSSFVLVCETALAVCEGLLEGAPTYKLIYTEDEAPTCLHKGRNPPLWTSWAWPVRMPSDPTYDDVYLAREDGLIECFNLEGGLSFKLESNIDTAFACLRSGTSDILIVGGDSSPGGLYMVQESDESARLLSPLPNWTPLNDVLCIPNGLRKTVGGPSPPMAITEELGTPMRVLGCTGRCTGRGSHGAISEILTGTEAEVRIELSELESTIRGIWPLPKEPVTYSDNARYDCNSSLLLLSVADRSLLLEPEDDGNGTIGGVTAADSTWLDLAAPTITAAFVNGFIVQITERSISMSEQAPLIDLDNSPPFPVYRTNFDDDTVALAACIYQHSSAMVAFQTKDGSIRLDVLSLGWPKSAEQKALLDQSRFAKTLESTLLDVYPTCLSTCTFGGVTYCAVGHEARTLAGDIPEDGDINNISTLFLYRYDGDSMSSNAKIQIRTPTADVKNINFTDSCVSIRMLSCQGGPDLECQDSESGMLLAGHRNGSLAMVCFKLSETGEFQETASAHRQVGVTDVNVSMYPSVPSAAYICCGDGLYRVQHTGKTSPVPSITRILLKHSDTLEYPKKPVDAVCQFANHLLVTSGKQLLGLQMNHYVAGFFNDTKLTGSVSHMVYSESANLCVAAVVRDGGPEVLFMNNITGAMRSSPLRSNLKWDRILCLERWRYAPQTTPAVEEELFVAGTKSGSLTIFRRVDNSAFEGNNTSECSYRVFHELPIEGPIHALTQGWPLSDILFCCIGRKLYAMRLEGDKSPTLKKLAKYLLPSIAVSMAYDGHYLHVLTAKDSLISLLYDKHASFYVHYVDEVGRAGLHLTTFSDEAIAGKDSSMVLLSDKDCSVVALRCKHLHTGQIFPREFETLFEAELSTCMTKFCLANIRPRWDFSRMQDPLPGIIPWNGTTREDLLGISIDGTVRQFSLVQGALLQLLAVLDSFARRSDSICPGISPYEPSGDSDALDKHINGDNLRGWLRSRGLEYYLACNTSVPEFAATSPLEDFTAAVTNYWPETDLGSTMEERARSGTRLVYGLFEQLFRPVI